MTDESESPFPEVLRLREAWKSAPPAPDLTPFILAETRADSPRLVALIDVDVLERRRLHLPWSLRHYREVLGDLAGPGTPLARRLIMLERMFGAEAGEPADRLGAEYADDIAAVEDELANAPTVSSPRTDWSDSSSDSSRLRSAGGDALIGRTIGHYHVQGVIGRGGMGVVYEARQEQPSRIVALKVINPGVATEEMLRRFEHEAEILGRLQHPGIAHIYEAGTFDLGAGPQPFFAMEYIRGESLTKYADRVGLGTRDRLALMVKVCEAVEHAHRRFVIHRDLKPGNILVTETGEPKVLDFGVARATDSDIQTTTLRTDIGQLIGTIPYMSPEQAGGDPDDLDTRSDVYALGVVCYELLAGRLPYNLARKMVHEAVRIIREDDPTPLSSVNRTLRGDVEIMVGKAMEKEKDRRYQSPQDFASDIERYLADRPIVARAPSTSYQLRKFARRNKALVGGVAATFIALTAGLITSLILLGEANAAWEAEAQRADELEKVSEFQASQLSGIETEVMGIRLRRDILDQRQAVLQSRGMEHPEIEAAMKELESSLGGVNFTNVALNSLEINIFDRALKAIDEQFADQPLVKARLLQTLADTLQDLGLLDRALVAQQEALEVRRRVLGNEHPDTLNSTNSMAQIMLTAGRLDEADAHLREALDRRRRVLGAEHPDTLTSLSNMASLRAESGDLPEAERLSREALDGRRRTLGEHHPDSLASLNNLGSCLYAQGKLREAEDCYRGALAGWQALRGEDHPHTFTAWHNLGTLLDIQGRIAEAEPCYARALSGRRRLLGDDHPDTFKSLTNMGSLLATQGRLSDAEPYYREVLERRIRAFGNGHLATLNSMSAMAALLDSQGKPAEAEPFYRTALDALRRLVGDAHPSTIQTMSNLSALLRDSGRLDEAEELGTQVVATARMAIAPGHWHLAVFLSEHARTQALRQRFDEAEQLVLEAHSILAEAFDATHVRVQGAIEQLAELYDAWHAAEPDAGHDAKAAQWRAKLAELQEPESVESRSSEGQDAGQGGEGDDGK